MSKESGRLAWLYAALGKQYARIEGLLRRLTGIAPDPNKPQLFRKFACWLQQVAAAQDDAHRTIRQIEAVEERHRLMRLGKKLKKAGPSDKEEYERNWLWLLVLWMLLMQGPKPQPEQKPQPVNHPFLDHHPHLAMALHHPLILIIVLKIVVKKLLASKYQPLSPKNRLLRLFFGKGFVAKPAVFQTLSPH